MLNDGTAAAVPTYQAFRLRTAELGGGRAGPTAALRVARLRSDPERVTGGILMRETMAAPVLVSARNCFYPDQPYSSRLLAFCRGI